MTTIATKIVLYAIAGAIMLMLYGFAVDAFSGLSTAIDTPNGSSDGRYHTCGLRTDDGVTEYLDAYAARCSGTP